MVYHSNGTWIKTFLSDRLIIVAADSNTNKAFIIWIIYETTVTPDNDTFQFQ